MEKRMAITIESPAKSKRLLSLDVLRGIEIHLL
jgi:hypothetical protein